MKETAYQTRLERILGVPLAEDAARQWPQSGELIRGKARIAEVESHFEGLRLGVGRRRSACGDTLAVEWSADYEDGRVYRNVTIPDGWTRTRVCEFCKLRNDLDAYRSALSPPEGLPAV
ncbi:MAG TPA: hypothetical protein VIC84_20655 [Blastocatellia bacterium]|jgi:hypothetical protein